MENDLPPDKNGKLFSFYASVNIAGIRIEEGKEDQDNPKWPPIKEKKKSFFFKKKAFCSWEKNNILFTSN